MKICRFIQGLLLGLLLTSAGFSATAQLVAGGGKGGSGSRATEVDLGKVFGGDEDAQGNLFLIDYGNHRLFRITPDGRADIIVGVKGTKGDAGDGGPAADAMLNTPHSVAVHRPSGDIYIADTLNHRVRRIDAKTGVIATFAGGGKANALAAADSSVAATNALFGGIYCIAFSPDFQHLVLTDLDNKQIRMIDMATKQVTLVAGNGKKAVPADGSVAKTSPLMDPRAAAMDAAGNVYILERGGNALRVVDHDGKIKAVAGTGKKGFGGDGGPALQAQLNGPKHLWIESNGNVLIADTENHVIRRVDVKAGTISRVAGSGTKGNAGAGGDPLQLQLAQPHGVFVTRQGIIHICDSINGRVIKIAD